MKGFKKYLEGIGFDDDWSSLKSHPLLDATIGVEVEFIMACIPLKDIRPDQIAVGLQYSESALEHIADEINYEYEGEGIDDDVLTEWCEKNKTEAYRLLRERVESYEGFGGGEENDWQEIVFEYWKWKFAESIDAAGFQSGFGERAAGGRWAVGVDGYDTEYNLPVIEVRSAILTPRDLPKLQEVLTGFAALGKANQQDLLARGNTGIHVHVGNANTGNIRGTRSADAFSRLAAAAYTDENELWDQQLKYDRSFERHSLMNKQGDFSSYGDKGAHDEIVQKFIDLSNMHFKRAKTFTVANQDLWTFFSANYNRNKGINIVSEHPTVEYRYLSSAMLLEPNGPQTVVQWVRYFITNNASQSNKGRIQFEDEDTRVVLTKMPNDNVRVDILNKPDEEEGERWPRIPKPGLPRSMMNPPADPLQRPLDVPVHQWWSDLTLGQRQIIRRRQAGLPDLP